MKNKIEVEDHWKHELTKLRCWLDGFKHGRMAPGDMDMHIPGEDILRQIIIAIDFEKAKK